MKPWKNNTKGISPESWHLTVNEKGELMVGGCCTVMLAERYGTPLHVVNTEWLIKTATGFLTAVQMNYPKKASVHYAFKCNPVPGILHLLRHAGLKAEIMSDYELYLAKHSGFMGDEIIVNGPFKPEGFLRNCILNKVRFIIADSLQELDLLHKISRELDTPVDILLRINPDYTPGGMNQGSSTANRRLSPLGLDIVSGEADRAFIKLRHYSRLHFRGLHFHIGTGITDPGDYYKALLRLKPFIRRVKTAGFNISIFDAGGGFGTAFSREMTSFELLKYQFQGKLPKWKINESNLSAEAFVTSVTEGLCKLFEKNDLPELILEPGRSVSGPNQLLLLSVHQIRQRSNGRKWLITDGGIGTVTMPTLYEFHKLLLCNDVFRQESQKITVSGPGCFSADVVYRNLKMPAVQPGEIIAVMDSGAYFTSWESSFGYPFPAIVSAENGFARLLRRRESFSDKLIRDTVYQELETLDTPGHLVKP